MEHSEGEDAEEDAEEEVSSSRKEENMDGSIFPMDVESLAVSSEILDCSRKDEVTVVEEEEEECVSFGRESFTLPLPLSLSASFFSSCDSMSSRSSWSPKRKW
jgi:hypothetical protein